MKKISEQIKTVNWLPILAFYGIILIGTYLARQLPNLLNLILTQLTDIPFSFNYNHGFVVLIVSFLAYRFSGIKQEITLLGNNKIKSILFPVILFTAYSIYGINNSHGVNIHLWALLTCSFAFIYNLMEEYAWRGYLIESTGTINYVLKSLISGILWAIWHILIFKNFDQYGGFWIFMAFCIVFSFILTFAVLRTKSIIVAAAMHAFIIQMNIVSLICFSLFILLLVTWNKKIMTKTKYSSRYN
ncbi:CPBP family intramembrane glutamic endopeptidase [Flavobacterium cerinum]|uniref:CPBP family intramembrane metalloprotease n=1 Tax=Flavobacterium cerinum TaxID=2502784 RepID=A0ABY5IRL1_9FLAO|nr:CPBP family intramembrane glutamic endopeptidase [Flavobacterium cerinum]UUC44076.1 CPBP family intramembrane metalloprotease [Flavobacterium cerinum]